MHVRCLELIHVVEQALLLECLLYLPRMDALFELGVDGDVRGSEGLVSDRAGGVVQQPLEDARVIKGVAVNRLDLQQVTRENSSSSAQSQRTGCFIRLPLSAQQNSAGTSVHAASAAPGAAFGFSSETTAPRVLSCAASASRSALMRRCSFLIRRAAASSAENVAPLESTMTPRRAWIEGSGPSASTTLPYEVEEAAAAAAAEG